MPGKRSLIERTAKDSSRPEPRNSMVFDSKNQKNSNFAKCVERSKVRGWKKKSSTIPS